MFNWTIHDDFENVLESFDKWDRKGTTYNTQLGWHGQMSMLSHATYQWSASGHMYSNTLTEETYGFKADISLDFTRTTFTGGYGHNVVGMQISPSTELYMGFFSEGLTSPTATLGIGWRINGAENFPVYNALTEVTFGQTYEVAMVLSDSKDSAFYFLNNEPVYGISITPPADGVSRVFMETSIDSYLQSDFTMDNVYLNIVPEPATLILLGLGGLLIRKRQS